MPRISFKLAENRTQELNKIAVEEKGDLKSRSELIAEIVTEWMDRRKDLAESS